ncbi:RICIN domain-containing protein [Actinocorallia herbida]|uniref:RICIN domain-containing protein n=1 Tax=Actinocorallia herbida TaxID=58109 RepID=UPI0011CDF36F|nr:hypothetical protein [Actinocorallia herbida]
MVISLVVGSSVVGATGAVAYAPIGRTVQITSVVDGTCIEAVEILGRSFVYSAGCTGGADQDWVFTCLGDEQIPSCDVGGGYQVLNIVHADTGLCLDRDYNATPGKEHDRLYLGPCLGVTVDHTWAFKPMPEFGGFILGGFPCVTRTGIGARLRLSECWHAPTADSVWRTYHPV